MSFFHLHRKQITRSCCDIRIFLITVMIFIRVLISGPWNKGPSSIFTKVFSKAWHFVFFSFMKSSLFNLCISSNSCPDLFISWVGSSNSTLCLSNSKCEISLLMDTLRLALSFQMFTLSKAFVLAFPRIDSSLSSCRGTKVF